MRLPAKFPEINFAILIIFGSAWLYSEIVETQLRERQAKEMTEFMRVGSRFTHEDGDRLEARIERLEEFCEIPE